MTKKKIIHYNTTLSGDDQTFNLGYFELLDGNITEKSKVTIIPSHYYVIGKYFMQFTFTNILDDDGKSLIDCIFIATAID